MDSTNRLGVDQLLGAVPDTLLLEAVLLAHKLHQRLDVGHAPLELQTRLVSTAALKWTYLDGGGVGDLRVFEELARLGKLPVRRQGILGLVEVLNDLLDGTVLFHQRHRLGGANAADRLAVVAAQEDAQIDELRQ